MALRHILHADVVQDIIEEAQRAHELHREDSMISPLVTDGKRLAILMEEVGELATETLADVPGPNMYTEAIQVAAMAATWAEKIRRESIGKEGQPSGEDSHYPLDFRT